MREQLWLLPSGDATMPLRATVFRPAESADDAPRPLVVINHGTSAATRLAVSLPVYYWLSRWFVERGYVVVLPQRRGHGATGGPLAEAVGTCANPDHAASGRIAADDIAAAIRHMERQKFVAPQQTIVVGISTGGWASLALASQYPELAHAVINFAGGRGGHAHGRANEICDAKSLVEAARAYGRTAASVPTLWLYSRNDSFFGPNLAKKLATAWQNAGGNVELHQLPAYGRDGHTLADNRSGWNLWGNLVDQFLERTGGVPRAKGGSVAHVADGAQPVLEAAADGRTQIER
jgi:pimeloyl-ACP methyl ester carboxylesterase